ncbi:MAG: hypothetical protein IJU25_07360 [Lachnospiraceae bacterium]|nr:hypothetical protein [Lachnospiraceae bacterium]
MDLKKTKIVFIIRHPYAKRDHVRFGAKYLMDRGYQVEIWRIMSADSLQMEWTAGMYSGSNYHEYTEEMYADALDRDRDCSLFIFQGKIEALYPAAGKGCRYIILAGLGVLPVMHTDDEDLLYHAPGANLLSKLANRLERLTPDHLRKRILQKSLNRKRSTLLSENPPLFFVTSTQYAAKRYLTGEERSGRVLYTHSMDYDRYIEANRKDANTHEKHIVFIDSGYFHKNYDFYREKKDSRQDAGEHFFGQLNALFASLEAHYGLPVVIAGHPHSVYEDEFGARELVFDQTCELVKDAALVIMSTSTAVSFAILYDKPVLKIYNQFMRQMPGAYGLSLYGYIALETATNLGCGILDMDDVEKMTHPWDFALRPDAVKREKYLRDCIIDNDTSGHTIMECVEERIRSDLAGEQ